MSLDPPPQQPAFPVSLALGGYIDGMSLRDYFAGQALVGLIMADSDQLMDNEMLAVHSYKAADAMMKEREKKEEE